MPNSNATSPRENVETATTVMTVLSSVCLAWVGLLFVLQTWGMVEKRGKMDLQNSGFRGCVWLLVLSTVQLLFLIITLSTYVQDYSSAEMFESCQHRTKFLPTSWVISKQITYAFLLERALVVHNSIRSLGKWFIYFRNAVGFAIVFGVAGLFYWITIGRFEGLIYLPEGICVMFTRSTFALIMFACMEVVLSAALLFLFVYPLLVHMRNMRDVAEENTFQIQLRALLQKNTALSLFVTSSALASMVAMLVLLTRAELQQTGNEDLIIYSLAAPTVDTAFCLTLLLMVSSLWKPAALKSFNASKDETRTFSNELKSKPTGGPRVANSNLGTVSIFANGQS
ncbi:hypothetical protein BASA81_000850 [Batrachochytrium salamandrivorans]|nr:hypothetical protein BASA81_000850 [Batrachochytrium salamandrivorans]